jgi:hypothetical protein
MTTAFQLRIELRDFKPAVYRDVLVDPAIPLPKLHQLIQAAMGWEDEHMHGFALPLKNERYYSVPASRRFEKPDAVNWGEPACNEARFKLQDVMAAPKDKLLNLYDFGEHEPGWLDFEALQKAVTKLQPKLRRVQRVRTPSQTHRQYGKSHD